MKTFSFSTFVFPLAVLWATSVGASDSVRIPSYELALKDVYLDATRFEEIKVDPLKSGGSTLMGLIGRLMGGVPDAQFEGLGVNRYLYTAYKGTEFIGVSHGSTIDVSGRPIHIIVHYDSSANVKSVEVKEAPENVVAALSSGKYLEQLSGYSTEDYQITWEKRRRRLITHKGKALREMKYPNDSVARAYFEKIVRALRYNVAFVDIAYFISRLPLVDMQSRRISSVAKGAGSPESMADSTKLSSPTGDRSKNFTIISD